MTSCLPQPTLASAIDPGPEPFRHHTCRKRTVSRRWPLPLRLLVQGRAGRLLRKDSHHSIFAGCNTCCNAKNPFLPQNEPTCPHHRVLGLAALPFLSVLRWPNSSKRQTPATCHTEYLRQSTWLVITLRWHPKNTAAKPTSHFCPARTENFELACTRRVQG